MTNPLVKNYVDRYFGYCSDTDFHVGSLSPIKIPMPTPKLVAYYLPQFHPLEENNKWLGNGYTEWTGVTKARPQFIGHHQPRLPTELGFYDLRVPEVQERQAALAKAAGLSAFCFYFYWFSGKTIMETPIRNFADNKNIDLEFCLCWANHNWTRPGKKDEIRIFQEYDPADDIAFISHLSGYLKNERYLRIDGKPLIMVWGASLLPNAKDTARRWREWCDHHGIGPIHICCNQIYDRSNPAEYGMDSATQFPPGDSQWLESNMARYREPVELLNQNYSGELFDYRDLVARARSFVPPPYRLLRAACTGWDNEPRRPGHGITLVGANPASYREYLETIIDQTLQSPAADDKLVFINAWNEWAEGAHLEPDHLFGFGYLEATKMACLRAVLRHNTLDEPRRLAVVAHTSSADCFDRCLGWLQRLDIPHDTFVTVPAHLHATLEEYAADKQLTLSILPVAAEARDMIPFLKALQFMDLGRYGRILNLGGPDDRQQQPEHADLTDVNCLQAALAALDKHPNVGIFGAGGDPQPATEDAEDAEPVLNRLATRMGVSVSDRGRHILAVGPVFLARTAALLPLATLGGLSAELSSDRYCDNCINEVTPRLITCSAHAAGLTVSAIDRNSEIEATS
jgi:hypothetical protein